MSWFIPEWQQKKLANQECYQANLTSSKSSFISFMGKAKRCTGKLEKKIVCNFTVWRYWLSSTYMSYGLPQSDFLCCVLVIVTRILIMLTCCLPPLCLVFLCRESEMYQGLATYYKSMWPQLWCNSNVATYQHSILIILI